MHREHDLVEALRLAAGRRELDAIVEALDPANRGRQPQALPERSRERLDVAAEPPFTVSQLGRSENPNMPWLAKNSASMLAGKSQMRFGSADQTADTCGTISAFTNWRE